MSDSANTTSMEVTYTVVELPLKSKRRRRTNTHRQKQEQPRTLRIHALHVSSGLVPSEFVLSSTSTLTLTPPTTTTPEEEEEELGQKRSRSGSDSDAQTQDSLPPPLPASSWLLAQELAEHALTLAPSYVRKRLTREPLASLPQWSSREPQVLRVVARLNRLDPLRPRGMPKVAKLLPLRTAQALLEEVGGDHKPEAQHLLYYLRGEQYEESDEEESSSEDEEDEVSL
jgi:hypothetical protein